MKKLFALILLAGFCSSPLLANEFALKDLRQFRGVNSFSNEVRNTCLAGDVKITGALKTQDFLNVPASNSDLVKAILGEASGTPASFSPFGGLDNIPTIEQDSVSLSLHFNVLVTGIKTEPNALRLSDIGKQVIKLGQAEIRNKCGDQFVHTINWGGMIGIVTTFRFSSPAMKDRFIKDARLDIAGLEDLTAKLDFATRNFRERVNIDLKVFQIGGQVSKLIQRVGVDAMQCSIENTAACQAMVERFRKYIVEDQGFRTQLNSAAVAGVLTNLAPMSFQSARYADNGLTELQIPSIAEAIKKAKQDIIKAHDKSMMDNFQLANAKLIVSNPGELVRLNDLETKVKANIAEENNTKSLCLRNPESCPQNVKSMKFARKTFDSSELKPRLTFVEHCAIGGYTDADVTTVRVLLEKASTHDCQQAFDFFQSSPFLDLHGFELTTIDPLLGFKSFSQIDLSRNSITDISILKDMPYLRSLDISYNQVKSVEVLKSLPNLSFLAVRENLLSVNPNADFQIEYIRTNKDACEFTAKRLVSENLIKKEDAEEFLELGFGPQFFEYGSETIDGWFVCETVANSIKLLK